RGARLVELLKQPQFSPLKTEEQVAVIYAGVKGYLDQIEVNQVRAFEDGLLSLLHAKHPEILGDIAREKVLSKDNEGQLKSVVANFAKTFVA
ncbi:ATP synthase alpha chain, partial [hydrothermal vent metagenome]